MFGKSHFKMASSSSPIRAFGTVVGGQSRYATGSYADIESYALVSGLAKRTSFAANTNLLYGAFFEYGKASVDTANTYDNTRVTTDGESEYYGVDYLLL